MIPITARAVYVKKEAHADPQSMARIATMLPLIRCGTALQVLDDAALRQLVVDEQLTGMPRHGTRGSEIEPIVIFNQFLYQHGAAERRDRKQRYPEAIQELAHALRRVWRLGLAAERR